METIQTFFAVFFALNVVLFYGLLLKIILKPNNK